MNETSKSGSPDIDIVCSRIFRVPHERVFEAFSNPNHLVHWWGPKGFTNAFHGFAFRPGGAWRFTMTGPDGANYEITKQFVEIVPPERIVLRNVQEGHGFVMTMTFEDVAGSTKLTWHMRFDSADEAERVRAFIIVANEQNFDRLETYLQRMSK